MTHTTFGEGLTSSGEADTDSMSSSSIPDTVRLSSTSPFRGELNVMVTCPVSSTQAQDRYSFIMSFCLWALGICEKLSVMNRPINHHLCSALFVFSRVVSTSLRHRLKPDRFSVVDRSLGLVPSAFHSVNL